MEMKLTGTPGLKIFVSDDIYRTWRLMKEAASSIDPELNCEAKIFVAAAISSDKKAIEKALKSDTKCVLVGRPEIPFEETSFREVASLLYKASKGKEVWALVNSELLISWIRAQVRLDNEGQKGDSTVTVVSVEYDDGIRSEENYTTKSYVVTKSGKFHEWPEILDMYGRALDILL